MNWKWHEKTAAKFAKINALIEEKFSNFTSKHSLSFFISITFVLSAMFSLSFFLLPRYDNVFFHELNWSNLELSNRLRPYCAAIQCIFLAFSFISWGWTIIKANYHIFFDLSFIFIGLFPILPSSICIIWLVIISIKNKSKKNESTNSNSLNN